ncbi:MAG TPA: hypothetical protein VJL58_03970 [Pyrinomonadaceae bacterium]|nr:hypothetical protein [Pyrinomonadaceae bacterium]
MAASENALNRVREHRFYILAAILFPLIVLIGFARTYYLRGFFNAPPLSSLLVHMHGVVMTAWVGLFITQVWFISSKRIKTHQSLGMLGIALGILVIVIGFFTAVAAAKYGTSSAPPDIPPLTFMIVPMTDLLMFAIFLGGAIYFRKKPANHKRLMLLTAINFVPPAIARIPLDALQSLGPLWFFGFPTVVVILALIYDTWYNRRLNNVFLAGGLLLIVSYPLRLVFGATEAWTSFAGWLTTWAA